MTDHQYCGGRARLLAPLWPQLRHHVALMAEATWSWVPMLGQAAPAPERWDPGHHPLLSLVPAHAGRPGDPLRKPKKGSGVGPRQGDGGTDSEGAGETERTDRGGRGRDSRNWREPGAVTLGVVPGLPSSRPRAGPQTPCSRFLAGTANLCRQVGWEQAPP